jgi:hypothetical protein
MLRDPAFSRRDWRAGARGGVGALGLLWLFTTGFSAPIDALRDEIRTLKTEQATLAQREESLMAKQDGMTRAIKRLKSESRGQSVPFGPRRLETALHQLRSVLDEREALQRRRAELSVRIDEALTRLRITVRDEILHLVSGSSSDSDDHGRAEIRALLALYPPSPALPALPPGGEPTVILPHTHPETLTEQTLLLRDQRERHEVIRQRAENIHNLLTEELTLYRTLAERESGFEPQWQSLDRQVVEAAVLIEALNERMYRMDETLRQLDILMSQSVAEP